MAKISWNDVGQRFYEAGTDRGVLYVDGMNGVPWNGLIGVSENISGGDPRPFYLDGYKYLNLASVEEYAATIRGFSSPREFEQCDGAAALHNGLFATQQPRKSFGFSYRTLIGNDIDGLALGYKIHLVYNALAAPAQRSYSTNSDTPAPVSFDWSISTLPPKVTGIKPTAHFIIDSRLTPPRLLENVENILYGSDGSEARLPDAEELASIFTSMPPIAATNLLTNGSFELAGSNVIVRRNFIRYVTSAMTGWSNIGDIVRSVENGQLKLLSNIAQNRIGVYTPLADSKPAGTYTVSFKAKAPDASITRVRAQLFDTAATVTRAQEYKALVANGTSDYTYEFTFTTTGPFDRVYLEFGGSIGTANMNAGSAGYIGEPIVEAATIHRPYFNGDQIAQSRRNAAPQPQPLSGSGWKSSSNATYSRAFDAVGGRRTGAAAAAFTRQPVNINTVLASVHAVGTQDWTDAATYLIPVTPGDVWTISGYATSTKSFKTRMLAQFRDALGATLPDGPIGPFTQNISAGNWARGSYTLTVPPGAFYMGVQQHVYTANDVNVTGGERTKFCDALIEKVSTVGGFFDGSTGNPTGFGRAWEGVAGLSPSYLYDLDLSPVWTGDVGASESDLIAVGITPYTSPASVKSIQSTRFKDGGSKSLRQIPVHTAEGAAYTELASNTVPRGLVPGNTYTLVGTFYLEFPQNTATDDIFHRTMVLVGTDDIGYRMSAKAADKTGKQIIRMTFTIPPAGPWLLRLYNGGKMGDPSTWWDNLTLVDGEYSGDGFNGDTPDTDVRFYEWVGDPHQSTSIMKTWYY